MKHHFNDITSVMGRPKWWDENGYPRYVKFHPSETTDIYAAEAVLMEVGCQSCGMLFNVAITRTWWNHSNDLAAHIKEHRLVYGDPPNYGCCPAGPTMGSDSIRVLEYWSRENGEWKADHRLEVSLEL